jgi:hypothetical protein
MKSYYILFVLIFFGKQLTIAQSNTEKIFANDTIKETIIYEYDTVFIAPDTLKMVDTLVHFLPAELKPGKISESPSTTLPIKNQWAIGLYFSTTMSGLLDRGPAMDSLSLNRVLNQEYHLQFQLCTDKWIFLLTAGWNPLHEQIHFKDQYATTDNYTSGIYDSLLIKSNAVIDNYYDYLSISFGLGRKWETNNFSFFCYASFMTELLMGQRAIFPVDHQIDTAIPVSLIRKTDFSISVHPGMAYKFSKKINWLISPYYQYSFSPTGKHPYGNLKTIGMSTGFLFIL